MSTMIMSTETIGEKFRYIRAQKGLALREVAALLAIDVAILSKIECGERRISKEIVLKFTHVSDHNTDEILVSNLSDKILYEIKDEDLGEKALKVAEQSVQYIKASRK